VSDVTGTDLSGLEDVEGIRLLTSDLTTLALLLNEARYRTMQRVFGLSREQANVATVVLLLAATAATHEKAMKAVKAPGGLTVPDVALTVGVAREAMHGVAGPSFDKVPLFGTLLALAALAHISRPVVSRTTHAIHTRTHKALLAFEHRYGHHVRRLQQLAPRGQE
jgi:hypothetical protein